MQIKCKRRLPVVLSVTLLAAVLSACGVKAPPVQTGMPVQTPDSGNVTITKTKAKATETELYSAPDGSFSMQIPAGWSVSSGGTGMYHSIRVTDPEEPLNQMFVLLKADALLHSQAGKEAWQYTYAAGNSQAYLFTLAPVLAQCATRASCTAGLVTPGIAMMLTLLSSLNAASPVLLPGPPSTPMNTSSVMPFFPPSEPPARKITAFSGSAAAVNTDRGFTASFVSPAVTSTSSDFAITFAI